METPFRALVWGNKINMVSASAGFHQALPSRHRFEEHHSVVAYLSPQVCDLLQKVRLYSHLQFLRQEFSVLNREPRELGTISQLMSVPFSEQSVGFALALDLPVLKIRQASLS